MADIKKVLCTNTDDPKQYLIETALKKGAYENLKKAISSFKGSTYLVHLGELTKDPLTLEKEGNREKLKDKLMKIPYIGTTATI